MAQERLGPQIETQEPQPGIPKFPEGSLGFFLNEYLKGRERPVWMFEKGIDEGWRGDLGLPYGLSYTLRYEGRITTISELLSKSKEDLLQLRGIGPARLERIRKRIERFFEHLKKTPEMEFLEVIFGLGAYPRFDEKMRPLSAEEEEGLKGDIQKAFSFLNEKEVNILTSRYDFRNWVKLTYKEVGEQYGISEERARQIEIRALRKLRHPKISRVFRKYLPLHLQEQPLRLYFDRFLNQG